MKILKYLQVFLGIVPITWGVIYLGFIIFPSNDFIGMTALLLFLISFHSIWIWFVITLILFFLDKKHVYNKVVLSLFSLGVIFFIIVLIFDPGEYLDMLLD